jgi:hypothetical protein
VTGSGYRPLSYRPDGLARMLEQLRTDVEQLKRYRAGVVDLDEFDIDDVGGGIANSPQLLCMAATGDSIASGGDYVTFGVTVAQLGFSSVTGPGSSWTHPIDGIYVLTYEHEWDSYTGGGTIEVEVDTVLLPEGVVGSGSAGQKGSGTVIYFAESGSVGKVKVTQGSGSAQTCDALVRVAIPDPAVDVGEVNALQITPGIASRAASPTGETYFDETFAFYWNGAGSVFLAAFQDGTGGPGVDDRIIVNVTHEDASTATWDQGAAPTPLTSSVDLTSYFEAGTNSVRVRFLDAYGFNVGVNTEVWLVQIGGL